jgi:DNA-binding MarR family transcriptional regulator
MIFNKFMIDVRNIIFGNMTADATMTQDATMTTDATMRSRLDDMGEVRACTPGSMVLMSRLAKQFYRRSDEDHLGMHLRHLVALSYVSDHDCCPQQDLADAFCMDANNVVLLLNELEQLGYATRLRDPEDRRRHLVQITKAGRGALDRARGATQEIEGEVLHALEPEERETLLRLLSRALRGAEPLEPEASAGYSATMASIST